MLKVSSFFFFFFFLCNKSKVSSSFKNIFRSWIYCFTSALRSYLFGKKELIAWGKLNLCKQVDKVLKLIYLDADWSAAQWCLNRLLTSVPTLPFFFFLFFAFSCRSPFGIWSLLWDSLQRWKSDSQWHILRRSCSPPFVFVSLDKKEYSTLFLGGNKHTAFILNVKIYFVMQRNGDLGSPRTSNGFIKCGINQNRDYGCLTHKLGVVFLSQSVGPLACGCSSFSGIIKGDGTN